jgi:hypothetical protein
MKKNIFLKFVFISFFACQKQNENTKIVGVDWIIGKWENNSPNGNLIEIWNKVNDSLFVGKSYFIKEKDTLHSEQMQLKQKGENLFYISNIKGQNNDKPIQFNQNIEIEKQLVFENSRHDYPKKIIYKPISKDKIAIEILGVQQGKPSVMRFSMKKKK